VSPDVLKEWTELISTVGTLGLVVVAVWAFYTRRIMTKSEREALDVGWQKRWEERERDYSANIQQMLAYVEQRRLEERQGRVEAEKRLSDVIDNVEALTALLQQVKDEVIRAPARASTHA
jgi:hypothetical protein